MTKTETSNRRKAPGLPNYVEWEPGGEAEGTHLHGALEVSYARLAAAFGEPNGIGDSYKVDAEWTLTFWAFGQYPFVATIYNYKDGKNYLGKKEGLPVEKIRDWHIGCHTGKADAMAYVASVLLNTPEPHQT